MSTVQANVERDAYHESYTWSLTPGDYGSPVEMYSNTGFSIQVVGGAYGGNRIDLDISNDGNSFVETTYIEPNSILNFPDNHSRYYRVHNPGDGSAATVILFRRLL